MSLLCSFGFSTGSEINQTISGSKTVGNQPVHAEYRAAPAALAALGVDIGTRATEAHSAHGETNIILGAMQQSQFHKTQLGLVPYWFCHITTQYILLYKFCCTKKVFFAGHDWFSIYIKRLQTSTDLLGMTLPCTFDCPRLHHLDPGRGPLRVSCTTGK